MTALTAMTPIVTNPVSIFSIVLAIILFAPLLLNKLKIPHIIGLIVAGVAIGPYGLNILARDSSFEIFGQVGILYLMFLAGLEIDMYHLKLNLRRGTVFGLITLTIPLVLGVLTSVYLLDVDWLTSMLLGAMYAAHTLIAYPVVARFGITKSPAVLISIVGTLVAVIGALLVLAVSVNIKREGTFAFGDLLRLILWICAYVAVVLYSYPRITRWFFKRYSDKVTQYVYVLAMVFLSAWMAQFIGLEAVLGAFFAGLVLNRYIPGASPLMSSIEFVGNALFIPYFLIGVGMMINIRVLANTDTMAMALIMLAVALASKWLPAYITQKIYRMDTHSRNIIFGLTAAHTAVALAVVSLGYRLEMFDEQVLNGTVLVILVTCAVAPIITSHAAAKEKIRLIAEDEDGNTHSSPTRSSTLVAVSNPLTIQSLMELAVLIQPANGEMMAAHIRNENTPRAKALSRNAMDLAAKSAAAADISIKGMERYDVNTVTGLLNAIAERDITEVILGMHRRATLIDSFLGAKIDQLLNGTNRMLIISRCYIPVNTVTRIIVWIPPKAQYETGFSRWICTVANLTRQIGCRVIFCSPTDIQPLIRGVLYHNNYGIRCEFRTASGSDDLVLLSNAILDDDLFILIGARANSVSFSNDMADIPDFLEKHFSANNLLLIYPEQFGPEAPLTSFVDPLAADITLTPSPLLRHLREAWRRVVNIKRHITHRRRHIDL